MAEEQVPQTTLRDAYAEQIEALEVTPTAPEKPTAQPAPTADLKPAEAAAEPKAADDRPRGPDGKFIKQDETPAPKAAPAAATPATPAPAQVASHGLARPSSWKKDFDPHWQKFDPEVAKYILQRESEFAKGVSTYKQEFDQLKPLGEALQPFMPHLQQAGMNPAQWISGLGNAHLALLQGSPQQKLGMFLKLAQDYRVPLEALFQQGQDGKVYINPQVQPYQPPAQAPQPQPDVDSLIESKLIQRDAAHAHAQFLQDAPQKYPHYETVKETMARLLEAGFAQDYPRAYDAALRMPEHSELFEADRQQRAAAEEAEKQRQAQEAAQRARRSAVSPRSATPAGKPAPSGKKGLRGLYEDAVDEHTADRV